ncbi:basic amino acid/polyamine antiporter [Clostridium botulinum]|uniref:basic amino acid/polyamine antiporter n=1 Tax=Clostridium botulinum TaxID=1491 RepID=UPI001E6378A6|nr:basic amino acid/polyamine antiporter [Clostridium botulinum]MCC5438008.1 basic amino acid/polyamine antiporter [Clostridium botulinum]NFR58360.1 amino acid permease [Clostridium botulinum]
MGTQDKKLGLGLLITLGIGSMIGGGIFNSPTDLITKANPQAALIAWIIGGFGIICLALVFQFLANKKPDLKGGIYSYAQDGFGDFMGFNSAWGYWLSAWLGNIAFIVLMFKTINSLLGPGRELKPIVSFIAASLLLWSVHYIQTKGTKNAGIINAVVTIGKLLPLTLVVILGIFIFKPELFTVSSWSTVLASSGKATSTFKQVNGAMGTIIWCFIGVEASVVLSEKAESQAIVGKATVISLLITLLIYVSISLLAMGIIPAKNLAVSGTPLADVLSKTVFGGAGAVIVKLGLIISLFGALISWVMLAAEIPYVAAKDGVMPKWFAKENAAGVAINSLTFTNIITQVFLCTLLSDKLQSAYSLVFAIATTCMLIPYTLSSFYAIKVCNEEKINGKDKIIAILASIYTIYGIYAGGIKYFALAFIMYAFGVIVFNKAKKEKKQKYTSIEKIGTAVVVFVGVVMIVLLAIGKISL